jgi:hypothetical protein
MSDGKWHGWRTPKGVLRIGPLPCQDQIALQIECPDGVVPVAYFSNEDDAARVLELLDLLATMEVEA